MILRTIPMFRIIETDNFGGDYPDESFLPLPPMKHEKAKAVATAINDAFTEITTRFWREVPEDYVLQGGFEP